MKKCILFIILFSACPVLADEIYLFNNSISKGTVLNITSDSIEYSSKKNLKLKLTREQVEKIRYDNGKEVEFYDKIFFTDGTIIKGRVIKTTEEYIEYNPAGSIPYDKIEISKIIKITYDNGKVQNFQKDTDTDLIYFKDGRIIKAKGILISNRKNIEFHDEKNIKQFYGLNLIEKIVYKDGRVEYPDKMQYGNNISADKNDAGNVDGFFEFECGWNGYVGLGARLDYPVFDHVSLNGGAGVGMWGYRFSGALRYYMEYPYGLAFSTGLAYNTGLKNEEKLETQDPGGVNIYKEKVKYTLKPVTCINASILYSIQVNGYNRLYFEAGYSFTLQKPEYTYTTKSGRELADDSKELMDFMAPGGIMLTIGYAFAI